MKVIKTIYNILYTILVVLTLLMLVTVVIQKVSNNDFALGGIRIFNVATGSMVPKYQVGDILISKSTDPKDIKIGDDVVYLGNKGDFTGKVVTHQVIDIEQDGEKYNFHTKGLANDEEDPVIEQNQILGKILYKTVVLSYISKLINNLYSFYFIIFVPIAIILFIEIRRTIISLRETEDDIEEENKEDEESGEER